MRHRWVVHADKPKEKQIMNTIKRLLTAIDWQLARAATMHKGTSRVPARGNESVASLLRGARRNVLEIRKLLGK
jgi:hypothetical protein